MERKLTPALKQYMDIKNSHKDTLLFFRMGDFYELFFEDAIVAAKELEITLTARNFGKNSAKVPMCGVPYHSVNPYIEKLIRKGYKVAICEQVEEPKPGKKIVKREVIRVITPGTYFEDDKEERFLMGIYPAGRDRFSVAWSDLSTGDTLFTTANKEHLLTVISKFKPKEIITVIKSKKILNEIKHLNPKAFIQIKDESYFKERKIVNLNIENRHETKVLSAIENFIEETQLNFKPKLKIAKKYTEEKFMYLDPYTCKSLEITESIQNERKEFSLFGTLDKTTTGMGRRFLKFSLLHPLKNRKEIEKRLNAVEELIHSSFIMEKAEEILKNIYDIERILSKITSGIASPKDIVSLKRSVKELPTLKNLVSSLSSELFKKIDEKLDSLEDIYNEIEKVLVENPPFSPKDGGIIKPNVSQELDQLQKVIREGEKILKNIEKRERKRTGINSLKIKFNNVFGYYIEISKANLHLVPKDYIRRQTLVNAERFITPELKEFEEKILTAKEKTEKLEYQIFTFLRKFITKNSEKIQKTAEQIGIIDFLLSLAKISIERNYTKPKINENYSLEITDGRHPVLEKFLEEDFIPNNLNLTEKNFFSIVTGPNMGGKSVFLRQTALIALMAQVGSFVPARKAKIGIIDRIFSRVGASDNVSKGLSTFMMEMVETANILSNATDRSLLILDEIGRGTSTFDGLSIAKAVVEHIGQKIKAKTLFATHYHELTELEEKLSGVFNLHVSVKEINGKIIFTHKVTEGASEKSYGIHVAQLAGLPKEVIKRAKEILAALENNSEKKEFSPPLLTLKEKKKEEYHEFQKLSEKKREIINELEAIDISTTTPLDALMILARLKKMISKKV